MIEGRNILCFGPGDWWTMNPSCTTHIMRGLAQHNRVLYVNPFSSDLPRKISRGLHRRVWRKIKSALLCLRRESPNLTTFTPVFLPFQGNAAIDRLNDASISAQLRLVCRLLGFRPDLLWFENPRASEALDWYPDTFSVYHVSDLFADCPYTRDRDVIRERDALLTERSDLCVCVSRPLLEIKAASARGTAEYLPHGVDFKKFRAAASQATPPELAGIAQPIAGYFGTLTAQNDIELLTWCAKSSPGISFVFAGTITAGDYSALQRLPNVHFIGNVPLERIPSLAAGFDVCLLPWKLSAWIEHCNPLKFLEYMASGRPIVSVPIPQVVETAGDSISVASDKREFCEAITWELTHDTPERRHRRIAIAEGHDWSRHQEQLSALIETALRRFDEAHAP